MPGACRSRRKRLVRWLAAVLSPMVGTALLPAQTVSPVSVEYRGGAGTGSFDVSNESLETLVVTLEPKSFGIDRKGCGEFRKLDAAVHVSLSERSLRLPPKSRRTVLYKASAEAYPAWFSVYATFHGLPRQNGVNVALELPHTVYLLGEAKSAKAQRGDLRFEDVRVGGDGVVRGSLRNGSGRILRVTSLELQQGKAKVSGGGFPLLPGGVRDVELKGNGGEGGKLVAKYAGLTVEEEVGKARK